MEGVTSDWFHHARLVDGREYLRWAGLFEFIVAADGTWIACHPLARATPESFETYLLGQVVSFALLKRGIEPLHATAVEVDGGAVAFVGDCGRGKSTLGAAFVAAGHPLVTDDLLVVGRTADGPVAFPGPPRIKLFPEAARAVLPDAAAGVPMNPTTPKLVIPLPARGSRGPLPLRALYLVAPAGPAARGARIRPLSRRRAALALLRNTFNTVVVEPARLARHLDAAAWLAARVPVRTLGVPRGLGRLPGARAAVAADLARGGPPAPRRRRHQSVDAC